MQPWGLAAGGRAEGKREKLGRGYIYNNMSPPPPAEQSTRNLSPGQEGSRELQACWGAWAHFILGSGVDCAPPSLSTSHWHHTGLLSGKSVLSFLTYSLPGLRPLSDTLAARTLAPQLPHPKLSSQSGPELPPRPAPPANRRAPLVSERRRWGWEEESRAARGFDPGWWPAPGADATGEFGFF